MKLLKIKNLLSCFVLASLGFLAACDSVPEEKIKFSYLEKKDTKKTVISANLSRPLNNKIENAQPAKNYAALVPDIHKDPNGLIGLIPDRLIEMLGPPRFRRADAPAEIWLYRYGGCVLHLILYETGKDKPLKVTHYTTRSTTQETIPKRNCLLGLLINWQKNLDSVTG